MKNKKGFTLVELLAVIVILALIMGIAVVSVGSVISTSREKAFRETAASILSGVRQRLYIEGEEAEEGKQYSFTKDILEKGGVTSPYGGEIKYVSSCSNTVGSSKDVCEASGLTCEKGNNAVSYVYTTKVNNKVVYKICLIDSEGYHVDATDSDLLNQSSPAAVATP